jgi:ABC-type multidrug transport system ATPase subunit
MTNEAALPLVIDGLRKSYRTRGGQRLVAVDGIDLEVQRGECLGLLGPNGSGKSTTIQCVSGFYPADGGRVLLFGHDVAREPKKARRWLGVCQQEDSLDTDFSARNQLIRHARYFGISHREAAAKAEELLRRLDLAGKAGKLVEHLSGGMRRRLQVARALVSSPRLLILDEPTTGLDPDIRRGLWRILAEERAKGTAVLLSTHYMDEAERLCDRIALMHEGRILDLAPPQELVARHAGTEEIEEEVRPGLLWKRPPNLEDVFLRLTGRQLD